MALSFISLIGHLSNLYGVSKSWIHLQNKVGIGDMETPYDEIFTSAFCYLKPWMLERNEIVQGLHFTVCIIAINKFVSRNTGHMDKTHTLLLSPWLFHPDSFVELLLPSLYI